MTDTRAEPKPAPCPFCTDDKGYMTIGSVDLDGFYLFCKTCGYESSTHKRSVEAIAAHNRVARAGDLPSAEELANWAWQLGHEKTNWEDTLTAEVAPSALAAIQRWRREREEGGHEGD